MTSCAYRTLPPVFFLSFYNFGSQKTNFHSLLLFIQKLLSYQKCLLKKLEYDYNTKKKLKILDLT